MATYYSARHRNGTKLGDRLAGAHFIQTTVSFDAAIAATEKLYVCKLPKEVYLLSHGWYIETEADLDTGATVTISLVASDGTTTKTIISASTIGQGAASRVTQDVGNGSGQVGWVGTETDTDLWEVYLLVAAGPSTATSGTIRVGCAYTTMKTSR